MKNYCCRAIYNEYRQDFENYIDVLNSKFLQNVFHRQMDRYKFVLHVRDSIPARLLNNNKKY